MPLFFAPFFPSKFCRCELVWNKMVECWERVLFRSIYRFVFVTHGVQASGVEINIWITYILSWPHKDMEGLPGWGISSMPRPPPRQHKHERLYTSVIPTRRIWNDDYGGQMIFGDLVGLKFPDICLTGEEKPHPGDLSRPGIESEPTAWQARMLPPVPQRG